MSKLLTTGFLVAWLSSIVWLCGGRLERLSRVEFRGAPWLIALGLGSVVISLASAPWMPWLYSAFDVVICVILLKNLRLSRGIALLVVGTLLNAIAITAFGAMPVSSEAMKAFDLGETREFDGKHVISASGLVESAIGDALPVPEYRLVVSTGDLLLLVGAVIVLVQATRETREC